MTRDRIMAWAFLVATSLPGTVLAAPGGALGAPDAASEARLTADTGCTATGLPEIECDGVDDDCDGTADEDYLSTPTSCGVGACAATGATTCAGGSIGDTCAPGVPASDDQTCDDMDDDCDGAIDEDFAQTPTSCGVGACAATGETRCVAGSVRSTCVPGAPGAETCDGIDNDCDGTADEDDPGGGGACTVAGQLGVCAPGIRACQAGALVCVPREAASTELCVNGRDEDCDGQVDEAACACAPADTITAVLQTRRTSVKLSTAQAHDKLGTRGAFAAPGAGMVKPSTEEVSIRIDDADGLVFEGLLPAGALVRSSSGTSFKFKDSTGTHAGLVNVKIGLRDVIGTYSVKADGLDLPAFDTGTGRVILRVGKWCFIDTADACEANASGSAVRCR